MTDCNHDRLLRALDLAESNYYEAIEAGASTSAGKLNKIGEAWERAADNYDEYMEGQK
jgi:hypothetical protein